MSAPPQETPSREVSPRNPPPWPAASFVFLTYSRPSKKQMASAPPWHLQTTLRPLPRIRIRIRIYILHRARLGLWAAALSAPPPETPPCKASPRNHLPSLQLIQVFWVFSERLPQPQHTNGAHTRPSAQDAQKNRAQEHTPHSRAQDKYRLRHSHPTRYPKQRKTSQEG